VIWASDSGLYVGANLTSRFAGQLISTPRSDRSSCKGLAPGNEFADKLEAYVRRYDFDGNVIWTHQFGSNVFDLVTGIGADATGVYASADTSCEIAEGESFSGGSRDTSTLQFSISPTSPSGQIQFIVGRLQTLDDAARFNGGDFTSTTQPLEAALQDISNGDNTGATQHLTAFIGSVNSLAGRGVLTPAEANALTAAANIVISNL